MAKEVVGVQVRIRWGREWTGSHYKETPGKGCHVEVMQWGPQGRGMFRGCPLGTGSTVEAALADFVGRGDPEYLGERPLTVDRLEVVERVDRRK